MNVEYCWMQNKQFDKEYWFLSPVVSIGLFQKTWIVRWEQTNILVLKNVYDIAAGEMEVIGHGGKEQLAPVATKPNEMALPVFFHSELLAWIAWGIRFTMVFSNENL